MRHLMANTGQGFFHEVERLELSLSQIKTLMFMSDHEPETLKAISEEVGLSLPGVSRAIDGLHKRGMVKRVEDPADRRAKRVSLTAKGRRTVEGLMELRLAGLRAFLDQLERRRARGARPRPRPLDGAPGDRGADTRRQSMTERIRLNDDNRRWWTLAAMCFALFMVMLDNTVVNVALPSIQDDLGASLSGLEWTVNAYTLTFAVLLVTGGRLGDVFGRRRMFLWGVVVFAVSSAAIGFAPSQAWLVAGRAVQGMGAAFMMPGTLSIITNAFPPEERGKAIGTWAGVSALALAIGPVVGGALAEYVSWRAIFFLNLPVAAGAVAVTLFAAHESRDETVDRAVDWAGIGAISIGLTALVLALVEGNQWGWGSPEIVALLVTAVVGLVGVRRARAARARADGGLRLLPLAHVPGREPRGVHRHVRDARDVLLHGALHAELPRLQPARGRHQVPARHRADHRHRADRRAPRRQGRPAPADERRPAAWSPWRCTCRRTSRSTAATACCCPPSC